MNSRYYYHLSEALSKDNKPQFHAHPMRTECALNAHKVRTRCAPQNEIITYT